ncbi:MAG: gamma-glutamylcyclotransferase [Gammaproteobacteria bacterium]|nr:gamma-glutamylcyclotransferase [Gammaproteobacteria bacterium]
MVFVYGTLRRGECNHCLLRAARFMGRHRTQARYTLLNLGAYPAALAGGRTALIGELYALNHAILRRLDQLEDYPREYTRVRLPTPLGAAWIYLYRDRPPGSVRIIANGDWRRRDPRPATP